MKVKGFRVLILPLIFMLAAVGYAQVPGYRLTGIYYDCYPDSLRFGRCTKLFYPDSYTQLPNTAVPISYVNGVAQMGSNYKFLKNAEDCIYSMKSYSQYTNSDSCGYEIKSCHDASGRLCSTKNFMRWNGMMVHDGIRKYFIYDSAGNLDSLYWHDFFAINSCAFHIKGIDCDERGRITTEYVKMSWDSLYWYPPGRIITTYHNLDTSTGSQYLNDLKNTMDFCFYEPYYTELFSSGMVLQKTGSRYQDNEWVDVGVYNYVYDRDNRLVSRIYQIIGLAQPNYERYTIDYDVNGNVCEIRHQYWDDDINYWEDYDFRTYTWESFTAHEEETLPTPVMHLTVYPNPFTGSVKISFASNSKADVKTSVYNLKGQLVRSLGISRETSLIWDGCDAQGKNVCAGIYFIRAEQDGQEVTKKVIKVK